MRKIVTSVLVAVLVISGCSDGEGGVEEPTPATSVTTEPESVTGDGGSDPDDASVGQTTTTRSSGSDVDEDSDEPTPEGSGPLPANSIRIGDEVFEQMIGASFSDCFVQDGSIPFSINGALNDDDRFRFDVFYVEEGVYEASISNDEIFWLAAPIREGTELDVEWDVEAQTITGTGLFNDAGRNLWAYGSFQFTCSDS